MGAGRHLVLAFLAAAMLLPGAATAQLLRGPEFQVNSQTAGGQQYPVVTADGIGNTRVLWQEYNYPAEGCWGQRYDAVGVPVGSQVFLGPTGGFASPCVVDAAGDAAGNVVSVMDKVSGIYATRYDANLQPIGGEFQVNTYTTNSQLNPYVGMRAAGDFVVVWRTHPTAEVRGRTFDASGTPGGPDFVVGSGYGGQPAVDATGKFLVVWYRDPSNWGRGYDAAGAPLGPEFTLPIAPGSIAVVPSAPGEFLVETLVNDGIHARRIDIGGAALGPEIMVASDVPDFIAGFSKPAVDGAGNVLFTWTVDTVADGYEVFGRLYDLTLSPQGPAFRVNEFGAGRQMRSSAAGTAGTGFVVSWESTPVSGRGQDGDSAGVFARRLDDVIGIGGRRLVVKDHPVPTNRRITFLGRDSIISTASGVGMNPVADGAYLHVYGAGGSSDSACLALPAGGWTASGDPAEQTYDYKDLGFTNGPCNRVRLKPGGTIRATCRASVQPIPYALDEASQGSVAVRLQSGALAYCAAFGGAVVKDVQGSAFAANGAPAPAACPAPSASCP